MFRTKVLIIERLYEIFEDHELVETIIDKTGNFRVLIKPFTNLFYPPC